MPVVIFCSGRREWYRDTIVSQQEFFSSPGVTKETPVAVHRPRGDCDLPRYLRALPPPWCDPSLVVVLYDMQMRSVARNLQGVRCPKVLIVGDMHHYEAGCSAPVWRAVAQAIQEPYDLVAVEYTRQHLHFFVEAGVRRAVWLPCFSLRPFEQAPGQPKIYPATFMGGQNYHPYRLHVLQTIKDAKVPIGIGQANQQTSSNVHARSRVCLNISLNGDLNLRIFEVLAAGGFLLTDRLSPESGLSLLFEEHRHMRLFDDAAQALDLIKYYFAHEQEALDIAVQGHAEYLRAHRPEVRIAELLAMVEGRVPEIYDPRLDARSGLPREPLPELKRRVAVYEFLQELHRVNIHLRVLFWPGTGRQACDALDLPRLSATLLRNAGDEQVLAACGLMRRVSWLAPAAGELERGTWDVTICPAAAMQEAAQRTLLAEKCAAMAVVDHGPSTAAHVMEVARGLQLHLICDDPPAFSAVPAQKQAGHGPVIPPPASAASPATNP